MCVGFVFNPSTKFGRRNTQFVITDFKVFRETFKIFILKMVISYLGEIKNLKFEKAVIWGSRTDYLKGLKA